MQRMKSEYILQSKTATSYHSQPLHAEESLALEDKEWSDSGQTLIVCSVFLCQHGCNVLEATYALIPERWEMLFLFSSH